MSPTVNSAQANRDNSKSGGCGADEQGQTRVQALIVLQHDSATVQLGEWNLPNKCMTVSTI